MSRGSSSSGREVGQKSSRDSEEESAVLARDVVDPNCGKLAVLARDVINLNCPVCLDLMDGEVVQCEVLMCCGCIYACVVHLRNRKLTLA